MQGHNIITPRRVAAMCAAVGLSVIFPAATLAAAGGGNAPAGPLPGDTPVPFWPYETGALMGTSETFVDVRADGSYYDPSIGRRVVAAASIVDLRAPDTREAAQQPKPRSVVDIRSPDTRASAEQRKPVLVVDLGVRAPAERVVAPDRFHWGDFGIGVGVALGSMLLLAGLAAASVAARHKHAGRAATA